MIFLDVFQPFKPPSPFRTIDQTSRYQHSPPCLIWSKMNLDTFTTATSAILTSSTPHKPHFHPEGSISTPKLKRIKGSLNFPFSDPFQLKPNG